MPLASVAKAVLAPLCIALCAVALAACGATVSTSSYKGEERQVAQTISNLQADATAADEKKLCANDLAASVVARLGGASGCEKAIKSQVAEIDGLEASIQSVQLAPGATRASAQVKSTFAGRKRTSAVALVKEGNAWKISAVG